MRDRAALFDLGGVVCEFSCFSYQARATKPDARVFEATLERLGVAPAQCVFVDDTEEHVLGARAVGIDAIRFVSTAELVSALQQRGFM